MNMLLNIQIRVNGSDLWIGYESFLDLNPSGLRYLDLIRYLNFLVQLDLIPFESGGFESIIQIPVKYNRVLTGQDLFRYLDPKKLKVPKTPKIILKPKKYMKPKKVPKQYSNTQKVPNIYLKSNPKNRKYPKFIRIPKIYFLKLEILPETRNYNQKPCPKT